MAFKTKELRRKKIHARIRKKLEGTTEKPRLTVFRSNKEIYAQIVDDSKGHTLVSSSSFKTASKDGNKTEQAKAVGMEIAKAAVEKGISSVVFDRSGYVFHGRIKSLAEGAREGGLKF